LSVSKRRSVLLLTNSFSTGGVETHLLSLAKALTARGYFVAVASAGGSLEEELAKCNIPHIYLPLDERKLYNIFLARKLLKEAVSVYRFDILHAHSRLSAFVVSLLPKSLRRHFVTTAHLDFKITPLTRFFSCWGEKTLAVSEDIRAYLVREYALSYRQIFVTVNGIDTNRFDKKGMVAVNREETALDTVKEKIILHISRMDKDRAKTAFLLCDALPKIREKCNAKLILVGGGDCLPALEKRVAEDAFLHGAVSVIGEAVDILPYLHIADVFVGVSRAALEAMSCGIPTILSGNSGYMGVYRKEKLSEAASSNFCCRGALPPTADALCRDLISLLTAHEDALTALSVECRDTVLCHYSLDKMTDDCEALYASLSPRTKKCRNLILGYHGFGNLGDDLLLETMIEGIRSLDPEGGVSVISHRAKKTAREFSVNAVSRKDPIGILHALLCAKVLYVGGGTLLQKETSRRSFFYYAFWIRLAKVLGKHVVFYANGFGEFSKNEERSLSSLLRGNCVVTLRDEESYALAKRLSATMPEHKKPYLALTADSALTLKPLSKQEAECLFSAHRLPTNAPYCVIALSGKNGNKRREKALIKAILVACEKGFRPIFLLMQPEADAPLAKFLSAQVFQKTGKKSPTVTLPAQGALTLIAGAAFLITSRFHALVFGAIGGIPLLCLSQSEKCRRFCHEIGIDSSVLQKNFNEEALLYALPLLIQKDLRLVPNREAVEERTLRAMTTPEKVREGLDHLSAKQKKPLSKRLQKQDNI